VGLRDGQDSPKPLSAPDRRPHRSASVCLVSKVVTPQRPANKLDFLSVNLLRSTLCQHTLCYNNF